MPTAARPAAGPLNPNASLVGERTDLVLDDLMGSSPQETPKQARKEADYSVSSGRGLNQNSRTPANQEVKIDDSYQSPPDSTVRSRKAHKSRIGEDLSPLRQPQDGVEAHPRRRQARPKRQVACRKRLQSQSISLPSMPNHSNASL